jgi:hypothetical protein
MSYPKNAMKQILLAAYLPLCLTSCASLTSQESAVNSPATVENDAVVHEVHYGITQEDKDRLAMYRECLTELKTVKNPDIDETFNIVTNTDRQAANNRDAGSPVAYDTTSSTAQADYDSSKQYYSPSSPGGDSTNSGALDPRLKQTYSDNAILEAHRAQEAQDRGDMRAAREHARNAQADIYLYHGGR